LLHSLTASAACLYRQAETGADPYSLKAITESRLTNCLHVARLLERVQELEASEARVRELEADALMRTMEGEASFSSTSSRGAYEPPFDRDWVSYWTCWVQALK